MLLDFYLSCRKMAHLGDRNSTLKAQDILLAGAICGLTTRAISQPLDVLKIRFQLQVEPISNSLHTSKYKSMPQALTLICREEGVTALWKGHVPAQLLSVSYGMVQFWAFDRLARQQVLPETLNYFCSGVVAGCAGTLFSFPFDVIRTRLVAQSESKRVYLNMRDAFVKISNEGYVVFYRGLLPTFIQIGPYTGVQFMCFKLFDSLYRSLQSLDSATFSFASTAVSGSLAGFVAKVAIYPLDLTKKRMQIQGIEQTRKPFGQVFSCDGMLSCLVKTYQNEGVQGFFKGLGPSLIKVVVMSSLHFVVYDLVCYSITTTR